MRSYKIFYSIVFSFLGTTFSIVESYLLQSGIWFAQKGFLKEFVKLYGIDEETYYYLEKYERAYYHKQQHKRWEMYLFSQNTFEEAKRVRRYQQNQHEGYTETFSKKTICLSKILKHYRSSLVLTRKMARKLFKENLVEEFMYCLAPFERPKATKDLWAGAAFHGHIPTLELLINNGFDCDSKVDFALRTPLHIACFNHQFKAIQFLIDQGASFNTVDLSNQSPLYFARAHSSKTVEDKDGLYNYLLALGVDPNPEIRFKRHIQKLMAAIAAENCEEVSRLLKIKDIGMRYLDEDEKNSEKEHKNPLILVTKKGNVELVKLLLNQKRMYISHQSIKEAEQIAVSNNYQQCTALLLNYEYVRLLKADRKAKNENLFIIKSKKYIGRNQ